MAAKKKQDFDVLECSKVDVGKKEAELNLPRGYRFNPEDDELVLFYLFNKILGRTLPITDVIKEIDVYEYDSDQIPRADYRHGTKGHEAFYYTNVEHIYTSGGKGTKRKTKGGYWKETDKEKNVTCGDDKVVVGFKTSMLFNKERAKAPRIERFVVCKIVNKEVEIRDIHLTQNLSPVQLSDGDDSDPN